MGVVPIDYLLHAAEILGRSTDQLTAQFSKD